MMKYILLIIIMIITNLRGQVWPINNSETPDVIVSAYGPRDRNGSSEEFEYDFHPGFDLVASEGTPVYSSLDGIVVYHDEDPNGYGKMIKIYDSDLGLGTGYAHLNNFGSYNYEDEVSQGDIIGYSGESGAATGPHLHYNFYQSGYVDENCGHPLNWLDYTDSQWPDISPEITNAECNATVGVTAASVTVKTKANELDFSTFVLEISINYSLLIDFDISTEYRTDDNPITISLDEYNQDATRVIITTTPDDFDYVEDDVQTINISFDFSLWSASQIYSGDLCFTVWDVNDTEAQDSESSFSPVFSIR